MKLRSPLLALILIAAFALGIGLTIAFNLWKTEGGQTAADLQTPADIRGSHLFSLIGEAFGIPLEDLLLGFGITGKSDLQCKELETIYAGNPDGEIGTDSVRLFVALYKNLPHDPEADTKLPKPAYGVLKDKITPEGLVVLEKHLSAATGPETSAAASSSSEKSQQSAAATEDRSVKGSTTFAQLIAWGILQEQIEKVIGAKIGDTGATVKSLADAQGVEFSTWRIALQALVDVAP